MLCALQTVHNDGGREAGGRQGEGGKKRKKLNCNRIDLFKYNNTALRRGKEKEEEEAPRRTGRSEKQAVIDKLRWRNLKQNGSLKLIRSYFLV